MLGLSGSDLCWGPYPLCSHSTGDPERLGPGNAADVKPTEDLLDYEIEHMMAFKFLGRSGYHDLPHWSEKF